MYILLKLKLYRIYYAISEKDEWLFVRFANLDQWLRINPGDSTKENILHKFETVESRSQTCS